MTGKSTAKKQMNRAFQISGCKALLSATVILLASVTSPVVAETFKEALQRGDLAHANGDDEAAIAAYTVAKGLAGGGMSDGRLKLARLLVQLKRFDEAESEYQTMIASTNNITLKKELAQVYRDSGKFRNALSLYQDLINQDPSDYKSLYAMAICLEGTDSMDSAKDYYRKVQELAPGSYEALQSVQKMSRLDEALHATATAQFFPMCPELGEIGMGWWNLKKMPIHVYFDQGESTGYRPEMRESVIKALETWTKASGGHITFTVDPPDTISEQAFKTAMGSKTMGRTTMQLSEIPRVRPGIHVHWVDRMPGALGMAITNVIAEMENPKVEHNHEITSVNLFLHTNANAAGQPLPEKLTTANARVFEAQDRMLAEVAVHELGHALGLPHSSNPRDIMCSGIYALNSQDMVETRALSNNDLASLSQHYNNFQGTGMPERVVLKNPTTGSETVFRSGDKKASVRVANLAPLRMSGPQLSSSIPSAASAPIVSAAMKEVQSLMSAGDYKAAYVKLSSMLEKEPRNIMALYLRGVTEVMLHKYPEATNDYQTVMKLSPGSELASRAAEGLKKLSR